MFNFDKIRVKKIQDDTEVGDTRLSRFWLWFAKRSGDLLQGESFRAALGKGKSVSGR